MKEIINFIDGMEERSVTKLSEYEFLTDLYNTNREAFQIEIQKRIACLINNVEGSEKTKTLLWKAQVQWDSILNTNDRNNHSGISREPNY